MHHCICKNSSRVADGIASLYSILDVLEDGHVSVVVVVEEFEVEVDRCLGGEDGL